MFFLVMGFISLVDEIQFMLISSRHFYMVCSFASTCDKSNRLVKLLIHKSIDLNPFTAKVAFDG